MKTLGQIAKYLDGELRGDTDVAITRVVHPALVRGPQDLALVLSGSVIELLKQNQVTNAVVPAELGPVDVPELCSGAKTAPGFGSPSRIVRTTRLLDRGYPSQRGDRSDGKDRRQHQYRSTLLDRAEYSDWNRMPPDQQREHRR